MRGCDTISHEQVRFSDLGQIIVEKTPQLTVILLGISRSLGPLSHYRRPVRSCSTESNGTKSRTAHVHRVSSISLILDYTSIEITRSQVS